MAIVAGGCPFFIMENWIDLKETNGNYKIAINGDVMSKLSGKWRMLKSHVSSTGYLRVDVIYNGKKKTVKLHRLIGIHFIDNPNNLKILNHIDGNKLNNDISNLEWCTSSHNNQEAWNNGLYTKKYGADNGNACLTWGQAQEIRSMKANGIKRKAIREHFGVSESTVDKIVANKIYISL